MTEIKHWMEWDNEIDDDFRIIDPDGFRNGKPQFVTKEEFERAKQYCTLVAREDAFPWAADRIPKKDI